MPGSDKPAVSGITGDEMQDNLKRAAQLLAAAAGLQQAKGGGRLRALVPRAAHDDGLLAGLRSRVGDAAFEQAWTGDRSLRGSHAVEYAVQEAPPDPTRPEGPPKAGNIGAIS